LESSIGHHSPHKIISNSESKWEKRFWALLAALFLIRFLFLVYSSLDLSGDEAYYWDWSRRLDWCYYSKPPLVAWIMALVTGLLGSTTFTVRLPSVVLSIFGLTALFLLGKRLYGAKTAFYAVLVGITAPGSCALALIMTIDAPLVCFWAWALYTLWRSVEDDGRHWGWWSLTALFMGFGILSKPTMLIFIPLLLLFLWLGKENRAYVRSPKPYLFIFLSLLSLIPIIWWNWQHDWITFRHSSSHFAAEGETALITLDNFGDFIGSQLALVSPLTWILTVAISAVCLFRFRQLRRAEQYLLLFSAVPLLGILLLSLRQQVHGNWPAPFYLSGAVLLGAWGIGTENSGLAGILSRWRNLFKPALILGGVLALMVYGLAFYVPGSPYGGSWIDPTPRIRGWKEMGKAVATLKKGLPDTGRLFIMSTKRQYTSELAFYLPRQPRVFLWPWHPGKPDSQYDIWGGPLDKMGWDALIVTDAEETLPQGVKEAFLKFDPYREITVSLGPYRKRHLMIYYGRNLLSWPMTGEY